MRWRREGPARARGAAFTFNATLNPSLALLAFSPQIDAKIASIITERTSAVQASDAAKAAATSTPEYKAYVSAKVRGSFFVRWSALLYSKG